MKINAKIKYNEEYLPTKRHRIPRIREVEDTVEVELREIEKEDAKLAFRVTKLGSFLDENGENQFGPTKKEIYAVDNTLYTKSKEMRGALDEGEVSLNSKIQAIETFGTKDGYPLPRGAEKTREAVLSELHKFIDQYLVIDGKVYETCNEPRYVVQTFGLGHNHGGTGMFIQYHYNENISKDNYFNALQREEAIQYANTIASNRGDTNDVGTFGKFENIEVFLPEMVKCNPQLEHGEGDLFLNSMESLISGSKSSMEAGLLVMTGVAAEINKEHTPLLDKISEAKEKNEKQNRNNIKQNDREMSL